ncbi:hypothetical protein [Mesorhizobium sp. B1-1-8]|uniref:hypothetical protein n=1 Tax=Mesorhizobium sp. B1-1-8 TaxID=2589976 RepID=UPI0011282559|nr:hypothetical protein [Mesorhizobium sp. B1-1-8]UCI08356.1 hypothetical protein FJ974_04565 [Mesorhizobium sp. B1-1-8]
MDNLFFALFERPDRRGRSRQDFWLDQPVSGFGRLLAAVAIIGVAACLLDHAASQGKADTIAAAAYGSQQEGSWK